MPLPERIVLVGPMGAGKSTIGRLLARELGYYFVDSDRLIEERCGADIPWIFDVEGEDGFRTRESNILEELSREKGAVIATGGGAVMREINHESLRRNALVVYLKTSVEQQYDRTRRDRNRPLLQHDDPKSILGDLFARRDPLYSHLADIVMMTDRKSPRLVVRQLINRLSPRPHRKKRHLRKEGQNHV
ncbi:shikimate kinase AroK [Marinobacter fonticola]|uniref:shikimate kinase AroK n=1 Tax=Marinobacter fonticola TaxID=2603215 RepID=UPI0011E6AC2D|nr:shikimate kinase AroK [Marinobacter fonticola]